MKLTIIRNDGTVYVDGLAISGLDLSSIPEGVHALQWKDDKGWIEFGDLDDGTKPANEPITELPEWANDAVDAWTDTKAATDAAAAAQQAENP